MYISINICPIEVLIANIYCFYTIIIGDNNISCSFNDTPKMKPVADIKVPSKVVGLDLVPHQVGLTFQNNYPTRVGTQNFWESNNRYQTIIN